MREQISDQAETDAKTDTITSTPAAAMQIVIASFHNAYHVRTLKQLMGTCAHLEPGVEVHALMTLLMDRLTEYAKLADMYSIANDTAFREFLEVAFACSTKCARLFTLLIHLP